MFNFVAPINETSYGLVATNIITELVKKKEKFGLFPINPENMTAASQLVNYIQEKFRDNNFYPLSPSVRLYHQFDMAMMPGKGTKIGFPIFELDTFNEVEKLHLSWLDKIFVCSKWAEEIIRNNNICVPTHVVPLGVDTSIFYPKSTKQKDTTVFVNCGKFEIRKGHDILLELFESAFTPKDNVELILLFDNIFYTEQEMQECRSYYLDSAMGQAGKIKILPRFKTQTELAGIFNTADCAIFPSRAEGWNLEALEAMACGLEVIITNYSAHTEFCNLKNSRLVDILEVERAFDGKWFFGQGNWAKIDQNQKDQFVEHMRAVHKNHTQNVEGINTAKKFSWSNTTDCFLQGLK